MASKIVTLVQLIANRGGILKVSQKLVHESECAVEGTLIWSSHCFLQTANAPNSWAVVAQWRRFFELKDQEEEEKLEEIAEVFDSTTKRPISSMEAVQARHNFAKEHFRRVMQKPTFTMPETAQVVERPRVEPEHAYVLQ